MEIEYMDGALRLGLSKVEFESVVSDELLVFPVDVQGIETIKLVISGFTKERATTEFMTPSFLRIFFNSDSNYDGLPVAIEKENIEGMQEKPSVSSIEVRRLRRDAMSQ